MRNTDFRPGDIAWLDVGNSSRIRRPVLILRKTLCKDFSRWDQRHRGWSGQTYARSNMQQTMMVLDDGVQRIVLTFFLYKQQFKPRPRRAKPLGDGTMGA